MKQYLDIARDILENGTTRGDRTGTGTISVFGRQVRYNLQDGFPLMTTKKVHFKGIIVELLWFLKGATNIKYLKDNGVSIWDEWATEEGDIGPMYGHQWVNWGGMPVKHDMSELDKTNYLKGVNQIEWLINSIKTKPNSRRLIVTAWNPEDIPDESISPIENVRREKPALTSCHNFFQVYVRDGKLDMMVNIRSNDWFLGNPYNTASYALLTHMLAQQCDLDVGDLIITVGDCHLYLNHIDQIKEQLSREPRALPKLVINRKPESIFDYQIGDFALEGYDPHPAIKAEISV